jgi:hypothetical protein
MSRYRRKARSFVSDTLGSAIAGAAFSGQTSDDLMLDEATEFVVSTYCYLIGNARARLFGRHG